MDAQPAVAYAPDRENAARRVIVDASLTTPGNIVLDVPDVEGLLKAQILAHFHRALKQEEKGDHRGALATYLRIIESGYHQTQVAERAATLLAAAGERDRALKILEATCQQLQHDDTALLALCRFHIIFPEDEEISLDQAATIAREAAEKFPASPEALSQLVTILRSRGEFTELREFLQGPARQSALLDRDARRMLEIAKAARKVWPTNRANTRTKHLQQIDSFFEEALAMAGTQTAILIEVAEHFAQSGHLHRALEILEQLTSAEPGLLNQRFRLADIRKALGDDEGHLAELESLIVIDPNNANTHRSLAAIYRDNKDFLKASRHLQVSLDLAPGTLADHLRLCRLYHATGEYERTRRTARRAAVLFPGSAEAIYLEAIAGTRLAHYVEAVEAFRSAEALAQVNSNVILDADFHFEFGVALEKSGDIEGAAGKFRTALDLLPEDADQASARIYNHLGYAWLENGLHTEQAGEMIKRANELAPGVAAYVDSLGWFHYVKGEHAIAEQQFEQAWELLLSECAESGAAPVPADAIILEHAARAKIAQGNIPGAVDTLGKALQLAPANPSMQKLLAELVPDRDPHSASENPVAPGANRPE